MFLADGPVSVVPLGVGRMERGRCTQESQACTPVGAGGCVPVVGPCLRKLLPGCHFQQEHFLLPNLILVPFLPLTQLRWDGEGPSLPALDCFLHCSVESQLFSQWAEDGVFQGVFGWLHPSRE